MRYNEFPYKRVSVESKKEEMGEWLERFNTAESAAEQITVLKEVDGQVVSMNLTLPLPA